LTEDKEHRCSAHIARAGLFYQYYKLQLLPRYELQAENTHKTRKPMLQFEQPYCTRDDHSPVFVKFPEFSRYFPHKNKYLLKNQTGLWHYWQSILCMLTLLT